tara:strand:+ start:307 stop:486 length:180 start_codon:yes stop_codon:yes gene_type:complete
MSEEEPKEVQPGMTFEQVKTMIIGSEEKSVLLNIFTGLMNENLALKARIEDLQKAKTKS